MMYSQGSSIAIATEDEDHYVAQLAKQVGATAMLNKQTLIDLMTRHHQLPAEHRVIIWRYLFRLPMNEKNYTLFASQQIHPSMRMLPTKLPIKYTSISNRLTRLLSALTYWHPPLGECDWLPALVFPFLRMFERDSLMCFEFILTILCNWCHEWVHFIPNPPVTILARIDKIAKQNGGEAPLSVAWPALRSMFGEVATTEAALILFDNIITSRPVFLEYLVASFALIPNEKIINERNVIHVIERARRMYNKDYSRGAPSAASFEPLPHGYYPVMPVVQKVPHWREKEIDRIRHEAEVSRQQEVLAEEIEKESVKIERQRRIWMAERSILREIEEEQMEQFRRREQEILMRENLQEETALQLRRERIRNRRLEEEQAIEEWKRDCEKIQNEMMEVSTSRRATWANWLTIKESAAQLAREEVELELELLKQRNQVHNQEFSVHKKMMEQTTQDDQLVVSSMIQRNKELEEERFQLRRQLDEARAKQTMAFNRSRFSHKKGK